MSLTDVGLDYEVAGHIDVCTTPPAPGTLSPFIPLSLRAFKEEGERKTEAYACAMHMRMPLVLVLWERRGMESGLGGRNDGLTASVGVFLSASNSSDNYQMLGIVDQVDYSPGTDAHSV